jgi:hypothetical protein
VLVFAGVRVVGEGWTAVVAEEGNRHVGHLFALTCKCVGLVVSMTS